MISRQVVMEAFAGKDRWLDPPFTLKAVKHIVSNVPAVQPERKAVFNRDIAIEAICDEVMLRFDVSATQAYEIADTAVKRIEVRVEKMERGD